VPYWYQQNTFLYVREGHPLEGKLAEKGCTAVERLELLDFVHPALLDVYASRSATDVIKGTLKRQAKAILPTPILEATKRMRATIAG
jgi:hypothetical protein